MIDGSIDKINIAIFSSLHEESVEQEQNDKNVRCRNCHEKNEAAVGLDVRLEVGAPCRFF